MNIIETDNSKITLWFFRFFFVRFFSWLLSLCWFFFCVLRFLVSFWFFCFMFWLFFLGRLYVKPAPDVSRAADKISYLANLTKLLQ